MSKNVQLIIENQKMYPNPYFPVGTIYLSVLNTNPSKWFGGTWEQIAKGRTLVGVDTSDTDFNTVKKTGGEKVHTLTVAELAAHKHSVYMYNGAASETASGGAGVMADASSPFKTFWSQMQMNNTGGGQPHNNLQPYFTCYIWCRIA